jgi:hypothetical protein
MPDPIFEYIGSGGDILVFRIPPDEVGRLSVTDDIEGLGGIVFWIVVWH